MVVVIVNGIWKTKTENINTVGFWNRKWGYHGGGERDDVERLKPIARNAFGTALDVGCSLGHLCKYLIERGCDEVYGVDFSVEAIKHAKRNYPYCQFVVSDASHLPFRDKMFDCVTCSETLEHLDDYQVGLLEAERVGKKVIFSVPDRSIYDEHVWTFTMEGVQNLLEEKKDSYCERLAGKWLLGCYWVD